MIFFKLYALGCHHSHICYFIEHIFSITDFSVHGIAYFVQKLDFGFLATFDSYSLVLNEKYTNVFRSRTFSTFLNLFLERGQSKKRIVVCATKAFLVKSNQKELRRVELDYTVTKNEIK